MKKAVVISVLYSLAAALVAAAGVLLCASVARQKGLDSPAGWNMILMMPENAAVAVAAIFILLDAACVLLAVMMIRSAVRLGKEEKAKKKTQEKARFPRLSAFDSEAKKGCAKAGAGGISEKPEAARITEKPGAADNESAVDLASFTDGFRGFAAGNLGLYYEPDVIRTYVAAMAACRLTILQGISGTGKTSLPYAFGKYTGNPAVIVPVQPSWKDRTDLLGYYNEFTDTYTETELLFRLYTADSDGRVCTVVLDEMNIARVEYYFAEFLSLLELPDASSRRVRVTADSRPSDPERFSGGTMPLSDNVWFSGTANNDDSTLAISDKVYDRAFVIELNSRARPFPAEPRVQCPMTAKTLSGLFEKAFADHPVSERLMSGAEALDRYLAARLGITFGNRAFTQFRKFVPAFVAAGGTETAAADIMICRKILRKLDNLDPAVVKREAPGIRRELDAAFGAGSMPECASFLDRRTGGE